MKLGKAAVLGVAATAMWAACAYGQATVGQPAPALKLKDVAGAEHDLAALKGKIVVLEWINVDCPFVKKHYNAGAMQALQKSSLEKGVVWLAVCSSAPGKQGHYTAEQWTALIEKNKFAGTAVLLDADGKVGRLYGAKTTPHMFVVNAEGVVAYAGAIDDKASADGQTLKGAVNYVRLAVEALVAGKAFETTATAPYGCSVKY